MARLAGLPVFDPLGDQVGRVRDVVAVFRAGRQPPRAVGLVVEVPGRRRVFVPLTRVTSLDAGQVITTGLVNMRRFEQRSTETLVLGELLDRTVTLRPGHPAAQAPVTVEDVAIEQTRTRDWQIARFAVRKPRPGPLRRRGETFVVGWDEVLDMGVGQQNQGAANLLAAFEEMKPADLAEMIHELSSKRRVEVASALDDERLADVLEELPEDDRVEIVTELADDRAADVLEAMQPDDAADLLSELPQDQAENLLERMEPDEAADVRRLLAYDDDTAGGLMTTEPVIMAPDATVAEALAMVRRTEVSPALAAAVYVCRQPLETPTGRYLGMVHLQRMLREPPHEAVGGFLDRDVEPLAADASLHLVTRLLATYNLVALPVTDEAGHLLGVVTVDDVLDHLLPQDWREADALEEAAAGRTAEQRLHSAGRPPANGRRPRPAPPTGEVPRVR